MGKTEDIIKSVLSDKKLEKERVYRDEPLIFTASQMKSYTPPEYAENGNRAKGGIYAYGAVIL